MGSESTYIISNLEELEQVFSVIKDNLQQFEIEDFIEGEMYHVDSIVQNGKVLLCSVSKYLNSTLGYIKGEEYLASYMIDDSLLKNKIEEFNSKVINALGIVKSVTHLEVFVTQNEEIVFCEIGARAGGAGVMPCIEEAFNINLFEAQIKQELDLEPPKIEKTGLLAGWIIFYGKEGIVTSISNPAKFKKKWIPTYRLYIKEGDNVLDPRYSTDAIASFIITAPNEEVLIDRINWTIDEFNVSYRCE